MPQNPPVQTINTTTTARISPTLQPYYGALAEGAQKEAARDYQQYGGDRIAGFTAPEQAAMQGINQLGTSGGPWQMGQANNAMNQAYGMAQNAGGQGYQDMSGVAGLFGNQMAGASNVANQYAGQFGQQGLAAQGVAGNYANQFGQAAQGFGAVGKQMGQPGSILDADMAAYSKPYQTNVTDIAARQAMEFGREQKSNLGSQAASAGAFGGYRHGLQEGNIDQGIRQQISDMRVKGLQSGFDRGIGMFQADRAAQQQGYGQQLQAMQGGLGALGAGLGAQQFGQQFGAQSTGAGLGAQQFGQQFGQAGAGGMGQSMMGANQLYGQGIGQLGQVSQGYGQLGQQQQDMAYDRLGRMQQVGQQQRGLNQAGMDINYQDFRAAQAHPQKNMSWMGSILGGFPAQEDTSYNRSMYEQQPGLFQSALGAGVSGLGVYQGLQR